jgi:hypothetical protein
MKVSIPHGINAGAKPGINYSYEQGIGNLVSYTSYELVFWIQH